MMKYSVAWNSWLMAAAPLLGLVAYRVRHDRRGQAALKAAHTALQERAALLDRRAAEIERERDEFLATLSHELRSPLNAIVGWVELLRLQIQDPDQRARAIDVIERNAHAEIRIVTELLDLARLSTNRLQLTREPVALDAVVTEAVAHVNDAAAVKGVLLRVKLHGSVQVMGDRARLRQVVTHLLTNALKFTQPGGSVTAAVEEDKADAVIRVTDTGIGIAGDMITRVFDRFRQGERGLTRTYGGLGVGLTIVRRLVELHGGTVEAASRGLHQGATFTVRLPRGAGL